ncbi:Undecaprenol kinase [uncultured Paludibacter sp.]|nr:Undecaprenol kinase [uncultured Paludibacter sp.]
MKRLLLSFSYALKGIKQVIRSETNMKIHLSIAVLVIILGFIFHISTSEWLACIICIGLVFSAETMNTAIETLVDMVSPERKPAAGKIKDIAAGGVFLAALISVVVGMIVFFSKICHLFF